MDERLKVVRSELILGGQKSGKSRRAESLACAWLAQSPQHQAVLIATAQPFDDEMRDRIARHRQDRAERVPGLQVVEEPLQLAQALQQHSQPHTLVVVDCLTLWLTNWLMPVKSIDSIESIENRHKNQSNRPLAQYPRAQAAMILRAIENAAGPVVLVSNEIGLGVIPLGRETRAFVDALGQLNQNVAKACERVTFMAAGLPLTLKGQA
jgi:adenosylcobinamide kinase / adenosylcobinamide-phosphate guanylyltransferase